MSTRSQLRSASFLSVFLLLLALAAPSISQTRKERREAEQHMLDGNTAFNQKNYQAAIAKYTQSIGIIPVNAAAHFWKGYSHYHLKQFDDSLRELDIAMSQGFKPLDVYKVRSIVRYEKKDYDGALSDFREGLKLEPKNQMFLVGIGAVYYEKGNYQEALGAYQLAVANDPQNPDLYFQIATIQSKLQNIAGQIGAAEEAIKRNTRFSGDAYYIAADGHYRQRRFDAAEQAYLKAIDRWKANNQKKPEMRTAYRTLGDIYRRGNRFNDAITISKQALIAFPNDGDIYTDISWYYSLANRNQEAIEAAKAGVLLLPKEHLAYTNLCRAYNDSGLYQQAIRECNNALRLAPDDGETYFYLGRAFELLDRSDEAARNYRKAVPGLEKFTRENPDYSDGFYLLGNAYFADNQEDKAIVAYQKALQLSPRFTKARYNLGIIQALKKNKTAALAQYNSLLSLDPALAAKLKAEIDKMQ
jgi:tetratricopeptide (TPR) repeat protein